MAFQEPIEKYPGKIREVTIGSGESAVKVGGENTLPTYLFEGEAPHQPAIAMEVYDTPPEKWPEVLQEALGSITADPAAWAKKCQDEYGADLICLQLQSTDPKGENKSAEEAAETVKKVAEATSLPLIILGSGSAEKDAEVLKKVADVVQGRNFLLGPAVEDNYKPITAAAMGYKLNAIGQTPNDVNMAKQLNILITQLGLGGNNLVMDTTTGALGYGLEYTFTVIERLKLAALQQNDDMAQFPIISDLGKEAWRAKEAKTPEKEEPAWGEAKKRGILWEAITALTLILAGSNILIMRHPEAVNLVRKTLITLGLRKP